MKTLAISSFREPEVSREQIGLKFIAYDFVLAKLSAIVTLPNRTQIAPPVMYQAGNLYLWAMDTPALGNYLVCFLLM